MRRLLGRRSSGSYLDESETSLDVTLAFSAVADAQMSDVSLTANTALHCRFGKNDPEADRLLPKVNAWGRLFTVLVTHMLGKVAQGTKC